MEKIDVRLTWKATFFLIVSWLWHITNTLESGSLEYYCWSNMFPLSIYSTHKFWLAVPLPLIKGGTLGDMTLFCRLSFTTLRRIYHHVTNFMLTFLTARQVLVLSVLFHLILHLPLADLILCWFPQTPLCYWNSLLLLILNITFGCKNL